MRLSFVHRAVGGITESDVNLAAVANATVVGFNVRPDRKARELAESEKVEMRLYEVIYQVLDDVNAALIGMLKPEFEEVVTGEAEVREVFGVPRIGKVAGCYVRNGVITRGSKVRFLREGTIIWKGSIASLRRFKDDVREVREGFECGIGLENYQDLKPATSSRPTRTARSPAPLVRRRRTSRSCKSVVASASARCSALSEGQGCSTREWACRCSCSPRWAARAGDAVDDAHLAAPGRRPDHHRRVQRRERSQPGLVPNLEANPTVEVEMRRREPDHDRPRGRRRRAEPSCGRGSWPTTRTTAAYQRKTDREIPVVVLDPP